MISIMYLLLLLTLTNLWNHGIRGWFTVLSIDYITFKLERGWHSIGVQQISIGDMILIVFLWL